MEQTKGIEGIEGCADMSNDELRAALLEKYQEHQAWDNWQEQEDSWINWDGANADGAKMKVWRRDGISGTNLQLKFEIHFPNWTMEQATPLINDFEARIVWDKRWVNPEIIENFEEDKCIHMYIVTPKPPIAIVWQRDIVAKAFRI